MILIKTYLLEENFVSIETKNHIFRHLPSDALPYKCKECGKNYTTSNHLNDHIRNKHTGECPYVCNLCDTLKVVRLHKYQTK